MTAADMNFSNLSIHGGSFGVIEADRSDKKEVMIEMTPVFQGDTVNPRGSSLPTQVQAPLSWCSGALSEGNRNASGSRSVGWSFDLYSVESHLYTSS